MMRLKIVRVLSRAERIERQQSSLEKKRWLSTVAVKSLYNFPFGFDRQISILSHVTKVQNALASCPSYICGPPTPDVIVCSTEPHQGVRIPDVANLVRMSSIDWDLLRMMHTGEENRAPRVLANPMFQYFFFWLAWTIVLFSIPCFNACARRSICLSSGQTSNTWKPFPGTLRFKIRKHKNKNQWDSKI